MFGGWAVAATVDFGGFASVDGATFGGLVGLVVLIGESVKFLVHGLIIALIWGVRSCNMLFYLVSPNSFLKLISIISYWELGVEIAEEV